MFFPHEGIKSTEICMKYSVVNPDPHKFRNLDPDLHQSEKYAPSYQSENFNSDPLIFRL